MKKLCLIAATLALMISAFANSAADYRKAAEEGVANTQFLLGACYAKGIGVTKDLAEAVKWYRKAAQQGDPKAKVKLNDLGESW